MLAAADLNLVTLNIGASISSLPSKIFNGMASARPILAVASPESQLAEIVQKAECGWVVLPGEPMKLASTVAHLMRQPSALEQMGQNGRAYLEKYYSRNHCVDMYEKMLIASCNQARVKPVRERGIL
jgi:glycosyltransferase involved in cell wall biosynthesis